MGTDSLTFAGVTSQFGPAFAIQGVDIGDNVPLTIDIVNAGTSDSAGYNVDPTTVDVDPAGLYFSPASFSTTTFSPNSNIQIFLAVLQDAEDPSDGAVRENQRPRAGTSITVPLASSSPTVAALVDASVEFTNQTTLSFEVDPLTFGTTTIASPSLPPGLNLSTNRPTSTTVDVDAPDIYVASGAVVNSVVIGDELQASFGVLLETAPPSPVAITLEMVASSTALLSTDPGVEGSASITFSSDSPSTVFYIQGVGAGTATQLRVTAPGYDDWIVDVSVVQSGFGFTTTTAGVGAGATTSVVVRAYALNPNTTILAAQPVRGGASFNLGIT